ncbi:MAG TPA: metallophosphoesterase [Kofleriaceae bacterium]|nr:metallophosphoesterase [Kofleriaceae bacterium]
MALAERALAARTLARLIGSYVLGRPLATLRGAPWLLRPALAPACAAWAAGLASAGLVDAVRIGVRVRRAPVLRPHPALRAAPGELAPVCTLISDTHLVRAGRAPTELALDPQQWPAPALPASDQLRAGLGRVLRHVRRHAADTVLWCGDTVDTGDPDEWRCWREIVDAVPGLAHRVVPGNHDICFNPPYDEDHALARRAVRERAFQQHAARLADYPMVDAIITGRGPVTVALLDSCRNRSRHVLSNAIGRFGDDQLGALARVLAARRGPLLVVCHHHVWRDPRFVEPERWFETAYDADRLAEILLVYRARDRRNQVLVCHGHRHVATAGRIDGGIAIAGLPSTTLGDKARDRGVLDGRMRYAVAGLRADGSWGISLREVGLLSEAELIGPRARPR